MKTFSMHLGGIIGVYALCLSVMLGGLVSGEWRYGRICGARTEPHETVARTIPDGHGVRRHYLFAWPGCGDVGLWDTVRYGE